jgi:RNA polymerase subunit RPABC4/transcription elongation factor Spt4
MQLLQCCTCHVSNLTTKGIGMALVASAGTDTVPFHCRYPGLSISLATHSTKGTLLVCIECTKYYHEDGACGLCGR